MTHDITPKRSLQFQKFPPGSSNPGHTMRKLLGWWCSLPNSPSAMVVDAMGMLIDTTPIGIDGIDGIDMKKPSTFLIPSYPIPIQRLLERKACKGAASQIFQCTRGSRLQGNS